MPFSNPILGGTALVRAAIHSPNYVPGVAGWSINRDGTAEFANATIRGNLVVVGSQGQIVINNQNTFNLPTIFFYNADLSQYAFLNLGDSSPGNAYLGVNSGQYTDAAFPGKTLRPRLYFQPYPVLQTINETDSKTVGSSIIMQATALLIRLFDVAANPLTTISLDTTSIVMKSTLAADGVRFKPATTFLDWTNALGAWTALTFQNGWSNLGAPYGNAQVIVEPTGVVRIGGVVNGGTKTDGTVMTTLPAGARPQKDMIFPVGNGSGGTVTNPNIRIRTTGNIEIFGMAAATSGAHSWDGITFSLLKSS